MDLSNRHPAVQDVMRYFQYEHLHSERLRKVSKACHDLAYAMVEELPDGPQLTIALQNLLTAKDGFVRMALSFE